MKTRSLHEQMLRREYSKSGKLQQFTMKSGYKTLGGFLRLKYDEVCGSENYSYQNDLIFPTSIDLWKSFFN